MSANNFKGPWFIAAILLRFEYSVVSKRPQSWHVREEYKLVKASDSSRAYLKAEKLGHSVEQIEMADENGRKGHWHFIGLSELIPVYDALSDGAELMYSQYDGLQTSDIKKMLQTKENLIGASIGLKEPTPPPNAPSADGRRGRRLLKEKLSRE